MHLVIGAGNMGQRHGKILRDLGERIWSIDTDLSKKPNRYMADWETRIPVQWKNIKSVLICTPPETHIDLINKIPPEIPIFCEKPLLVSLKQKIAPRKAPSLMACNWLFCDCGIKEIRLWYKTNDPYRFLDIIHFYISHPKGKVITGHDTIELIDREFKARIIFNKHDSVGEIFTGKICGVEIIEPKIHCNMFLKQMQHWLNVVKGKEKSRLDLLEAEQINRKLIGVINSCG